MGKVIPLDRVAMKMKGSKVLKGLTEELVPGGALTKRHLLMSLL